MCQDFRQFYLSTYDNQNRMWEIIIWRNISKIGEFDALYDEKFTLTIVINIFKKMSKVTTMYNQNVNEIWQRLM